VIKFFCRSLGCILHDKSHKKGKRAGTPSTNNSITSNEGLVASDIAKLQRLVIEALERNDRREARKHLRKGLKILEKLGDRKLEAEFRFALGLSYLRVEGSHSRRTAFEELLQAATLALDSGVEPLFLKSLNYLTEAVDSFEDLGKLQDLVDKGGETLTPESKAEAKRFLSVAKMFLELRGRFEGIDLDNLNQFSDEASFMKLIEEGLLPEDYLHLVYAAKAQEKGDLALAEQEAQCAREKALQAVDPFLYVLACGAIARVRDEAGDRVGALTILFTCKASIEDLLGPVAGGFVVPMIEALEKRWGSKVFSDTLALYRAKFQEV